MGEDLYSTNYDIKAQKANEDPRLTQSQKDMTFVQFMILGSILIATLICYFLGSVNPKNMTYLFGYPVWVALVTCLFIAVAVIMLIAVVRTKQFGFDARSKEMEDTK